MVRSVDTPREGAAGVRRAAGDRQRGLSVEKAGAESCEHIAACHTTFLVGQLTVFFRSNR